MTWLQPFWPLLSVSLLPVTARIQIHTWTPIQGQKVLINVFKTYLDKNLLKRSVFQVKNHFVLRVWIWFLLRNTQLPDDITIFILQHITFRVCHWRIIWVRSFISSKQAAQYIKYCAPLRWVVVFIIVVACKLRWFFDGLYLLWDRRVADKRGVERMETNVGDGFSIFREEDLDPCQKWFNIAWFTYLCWKRSKSCPRVTVLM